MTGRYELKDRQNPTWKGQRYTSLVVAIKARRDSVPPGRFFLFDRVLRQEMR